MVSFRKLHLLCIDHYPLSPFSVPSGGTIKGRDGAVPKALSVQLRSCLSRLEVAIVLVKSVQLEQPIEEVPLEGIQGGVGGYGEG